MSKPTTSYNNIYHADYLDYYHPRKGKMGKNKLTNDVKKDYPIQDQKQHWSKNLGIFLGCLQSYY